MWGEQSQNIVSNEFAHPNLCTLEGLSNLSCAHLIEDVPGILNLVRKYFFVALLHLCLSHANIVSLKTVAIKELSL